MKIDGFSNHGRGIATNKNERTRLKINETLSRSLVKGSFNFVSKTPLHLDPKKAVFTDETGCYWSAKLNGIDVLVHRWSFCPAHIFELYADVMIRSTLDDSSLGNLVLEIDDNSIDRVKSKSLRSQISWIALWRLRERLFYDDWYLNAVSCDRLNSFFWRAYQSIKNN